jgi:TolA-binding protein
MDARAREARSRVRSSRAGHAGSVILVILFGSIVGCVWAVVEYKQSGGDVQRLFSRVGDEIDRVAPRSAPETASPAKRPARAAPPSKAPSAPAPKATTVSDAVAVAKAPASAEPPRPPEPSRPALPAPETPERDKPAPVSVTPAPVPPKPAVEPYPPSQVYQAIQAAEGDFKACKFASARERLNAFEPERVPEPARKDLDAARARGELYFNLLRETNLSPAADLPKLTSIEFRVQRMPFVGTVLSKDEKQVDVLLLNNMTASFPLHEVLEMKPVDALRARRLVDAEYDRRWRQIRPEEPMDAFGVAEYCLRNCLLENVAPCFERSARIASRSGTDLVAKVREEKARGLRNTYMFFMNLGNDREARSTLELLRQRYPESPQIAQILSAEREAREQTFAALSPRIKLAKDPAADPPKPVGEGAETKKPASGTPASTDVKAVQPPKPPAAAEPPPVAPVPFASLPESARARFRQLVDDAHFQYDQALVHLKRTDQTTNPSGWLLENKKALDLLRGAVTQYNEALDIYNDSSLWDRVRDALFKSNLCRKRDMMR